MTAQQADTLYFSLSLALPILVIALTRKAWIAIPLAAVLDWSVLVLAGLKLQELDPERDAAMTDGIWLLFGIIPALIFASILWAIKQFVIGIKTRKKPPP